MNDHIEDIELSELVDGELDSDRGNRVLLSVLDDPESRGRLKGFLQMRESLSPWRRQGEPPAHVATTRSPRPRYAAGVWPVARFAAAAVLGGVLVTAGFLTTDRDGRYERAPGLELPWTPHALAVDELRQAASVFAFHESVAGPLTWYAADDQTISLQPRPSDRHEGVPVAVFLHLSSDRDSPTSVGNYVVICREGERVRVRFPYTDAPMHFTDIELTPRLRNGTVDVRYTITVGGQTGPEQVWGSLAGRSQLGEAQRRLGQVALNDRVFLVSASAGQLPFEPGG